MGNNISSNTNTKRIKFKIIIDKYDAIRLLNNAEKVDMYIEECHDDKSNSLARRNLSYTPNSFPLRDYNYAIAFLDNIIDRLPKRLLMELDEIKIIHLMPTADGGMPHTRPGDIICYPNITQIFSDVTLIHELWHIHQRKYNDMWFKVFNTMGWTLWDGQLPEQLEKHRRYNPDTIDCPLWQFLGIWIPISVFKDISNPKVGEVDIWFYNTQNGYHTKSIPVEINRKYPNLPQSAYEHPRELTAYMLSEPHKYNETEGFKELINQIGIISINT